MKSFILIWSGILVSMYLQAQTVRHEEMLGRPTD